MAMNGRFYSYDVLIPASEVDCSRISYFVIRDGEKYVSLTDATRPASLDSMPRGIERYNAFIEHERRCKAREWEALQRAFPELGAVEQVSIFVEIPELEATHATKELAAV